MKERVYFVDFARSYAIFLALLDHSLNDFGIWDDYSFVNFASIKIFTSSATPTFLFLFGMMLELVYFKRLKSNGLSAIRPQLLKRSFQCYFGYFLTLVAGVLGGVLALKSALACSLFAGNSHYGNILKIYSVLIILAMPLLFFRYKKGIWAVVGLSLSYWLLYPFLSRIQPAHGNIAIFTSTFFGFGNGTGPSMLHALSIVSLGMLSAKFIDFNDKYAFLKKNMALLGVLLSGVLIALLFVSWDTVIEGYLSNTYRRANNPIYYLMATALAVVNVIVFSFIVPLGSRVRDWTKNFLVFGRNSLSSFTVGNIILNLIYKEVAGKQWNWLAPISFIIVMFAILYVYEQISQRYNKKVKLKTS